MRRLQPVILAVLVTSCAGATPRPEPPPPALGTTHAVQTRAIEPVTTAAKLGAASPAAQNLLVAVQRFDAGADRVALADALHALADALTTLVPDREGAILQVRDALDGTSSAMSDAERVRLGLDAATGMLGSVSASSEPLDERLKGAVAELRETAQLVDPTRGITQQATQLAAAMHAAVRAVYAANGAAEPAIHAATAAR